MEALAVDEILEHEPGKRIRARGRIAEDAAFFQDHFPDFPILPGVLALEIFRKIV